ncbi:MAG: hypothetical protein C4305_02130 [Thermoleophilia bacterium]
MRIPRKERRESPPHLAATEDAARLAEQAVERIDQALGQSWYGTPGPADLAALVLCRLRRARAGERGGSEHGDEAVRRALSQAQPEAVVWLATRAISYMDENGFPEVVERELEI